MTITALPTPPSRSDSANFATRGDAFLAALPTFATEANALQVDVNAKYNELASSYQSAANIAIAANTATSQAAAAVVAKDAAVAAWAASTSPAETLAAISKSIHYGAVVKAIIYDTSKDSDGGAWRKRCTDKSWYTESLGFTGTWGGQAASNAAGWAACGSVTGGAYQSTADGKFYTPLSSSTQTEIFRGNVREFPEAVAIVAETGRVVIYDLTQVGTPMWMVFSKGADLQLYSGAISSVAARDGLLAVGENTTGALSLINFVADLGYFRLTNTSRYSAGRISRRNTSNSLIEAGMVAALVNRDINDVALTVLDTAPIDAATGLPTPTIAVATAGGVSVIKDDGTVVNSSTATGIARVSIRNDGTLAIDKGANTGGSRINWARNIGSLGASFAMTSDYLNLSNNSMTASVTRVAPRIDMADSYGLRRIFENPSDTTKSLAANITNAYNSGWLPGDIRGAYLADTVAGTITASGELVSNGDFTANTTGWTTVSATVASVAGGVSGNCLEITRTGGSIQYAYAAVASLVVGRTYTVTAYVKSGTSGNEAFQITFGPTGVVSGTSSATWTQYQLDFVATATTHNISLVKNTATAGTMLFDTASVKLADPDRSVKNKGFVINGTLTKTAVASGAELVAWSGFSVANYLEQPYSSDLDFGTGDFCVMGWVKNTGTANQYLLDRSVAGAAPSVKLLLNAGTGYASFYTNDGTTANSCTGTASLTDSIWHFVVAKKTSGVKELWIDGVLAASSTPATNNTLTSATATERLGIGCDGTAHAQYSSMALWRISATAPSQSQIEHIYRTELPLFQASAQCTIAGGYAGVTALAYDETADTLHVGTTYGRSGFRDLLRIDSEATTVGAVTSLSANQGAVLTGGAASGRYYQPAMLLRDELRRNEEARRALGKASIFFDYTATASQTAFVLPKGYTAKALYHNGTLKRETTTGVYWTRSNDGFTETCTLSAGATVSDWISIMAVRA